MILKDREKNHQYVSDRTGSNNYCKLYPLNAKWRLDHSQAILCMINVAKEIVNAISTTERVFPYVYDE